MSTETKTLVFEKAIGNEERVLNNKYGKAPELPQLEHAFYCSKFHAELQLECQEWKRMVLYKQEPTTLENYHYYTKLTKGKCRYGMKRKKLLDFYVTLLRVHSKANTFLRYWNQHNNKKVQMVQADSILPH